jgi:hypothetical protein
MPQTAAPPIAIPDEVTTFCVAHGIIADLQLALRLAQESFTPVHRWQIELEIDPETDEEAIVIDAYLDGAVDEVLRQKQLYTRRWVESASKAALGTIRMLYNFV